MSLAILTAQTSPDERRLFRASIATPLAHLRSQAAAWAVPIALLAIWQIAAMTGWLAHNVLPAPSEVASAAWRLTRSGELIQNMRVSFLRAGAGFIVGGGIGFALGIANGLSPTSYSLTDTTLQMLRNIPHLALIPLVILWFGIDEGAKLFLVALGVFFPIYLNTLHGVRGVDPQLIEMGRGYGMSPRRRLRENCPAGRAPLSICRRAIRPWRDVAHPCRR
jgi:sulfonate transport system permease protein